MANIWADGLGTCSPAKHDSNTDVALAEIPQATKAFSAEIKQVDVKKNKKKTAAQTLLIKPWERQVWKGKAEPLITPVQH